MIPRAASARLRNPRPGAKAQDLRQRVSTSEGESFEWAILRGRGAQIMPLPYSAADVSLGARKVTPRLEGRAPMRKSAQERRQEPRFSFAAAAVIKDPQGSEVSQVVVVGIGMAGCRVEALQKLEANHEFDLAIYPDGEQIVTRVVVVYWHDRGFAGMHFVSMTDEAKKRLERLVDRISRTFALPETHPSD